jgi:hypothetical protein
MNVQLFIRLAGIAQIALVLGSFAIPRILNWRGELAKVQPIIKQMFWTYAAYILVINLCFGLVSVICYWELSDGSTLAMLLTSFIAVYWISRILIQFLYFDRAGFPTGNWHKLGELVLVALFGFLSVLYSWVAYFNYIHH